MKVLLCSDIHDRHRASLAMAMALAAIVCRRERVTVEPPSPFDSRPPPEVLTLTLDADCTGLNAPVTRDEPREPWRRGRPLR